MLSRKDEHFPLWLTLPTLIVAIWFAVQIVRSVTETLENLAGSSPTTTVSAPPASRAAN